jgi:hypothetical protein
MSKEFLRPLSHEEVVRSFPIVDLVPGWYFRQTEKSPGVWEVEDRDAYGRSVSQTAVIDAKRALRECIEYATRVAGGGNTA